MARGLLREPWRIVRSVALGSLLLLGCFGDAGEDGAAPIVRGTVETGLPAVGQLVTSEGPCSTTLIAPRVVIAAQHCIMATRDPERVSFWTGPRGEQFEANALALIHPDGNAFDDHFDFVAIALDRVPSVTPMPARRAPLDEGVIGLSAQIVGYGKSADDPLVGTKRSGWTTIDALISDPPVVVTSGREAVGCFGDSGGPLILGGEVIGVYADFDHRGPNCRTGGRYVRTDAMSGFIDSAAAIAEAYAQSNPTLLGPSVVSGACPGCSNAGRCGGDYCRGGIGQDPARCDEGTSCITDFDYVVSCMRDADCTAP